MLKNKRRGLLSFLLAVSTILPNVTYMHAETVDDNKLSENLKVHYDFDKDSVDINKLSVNNLVSQSQFQGKLGSLADADKTNITLTPGVDGNALHFTGTTTDNYLKVSKILNNTEDYTISMWMKLDANGIPNNNTVNIIQQSDSDQTINDQCRTIFMIKNGKYASYINGVDILSSTQAKANVWTNVVLSGQKLTDDSHLFNIYINGDKIIDQKVQNGLLNDVTDLQFGCHKKAGNFDFTGDIDSIRMYSKFANQDMATLLYQEHESDIVLSSLANDLAAAKKILEGNVLPDTNSALIDLKKAISDGESIVAEGRYKEAEKARTVLADCLRAYMEEVKKEPVNINIDENTVTRGLSRSLFGINHRYHLDGVGSWDVKNNQLYPQFQELSNHGEFGSVRYPGGVVSGLFQWKRSIGDVSKRQMTMHGNWNEPSIFPYFGLDEAAKYAVDELHGELVYVYNFGNGSAMDAADLVEYLNCEVGENPNGGTDWAAVRAANGHPEPYHVTKFEIGNELNEGRGYWMQPSPTQFYGYNAKMYAEGATRTFEKEIVTSFDNWNTSSDPKIGSYFSDGTANQKKYIRYANDVSEHAETNEAAKKKVKDYSIYVNDKKWDIVKDLSTAGPKDEVVTVNDLNGEISFGDGVHGMIPAKNATVKASYTVYKDGLSDYYDAMKAIDPSVKVYSGYSSADLVETVHDSAKAGADGGKFDGIAVHPYSYTKGQIADDDPQFYEKILSVIDTKVQSGIKAIADPLKKYYPDGSKEVVLTEYGIYEHTGDVIQTQTQAIYIAENLLKFVDMGIQSANKHCLVDFPVGDILGPGKQAVILANKGNDGNIAFYGTPTLETFHIFNNMTGDKVLNTSIENNSVFYTTSDATVKSVNALATKGEDGTVYVIAINTERDTKKKINIKLKERSLKNISIKGMKLESDNVYSENSLTQPDNVKTQDFEMVSDSNALTYEMQPHSIVAFAIPATEKALDTSKLSNKIDEINAKKLQEKDYTVDSWRKFSNALSDAVHTLTSADSQAAIDQALQTLDDAYVGLVVKPITVNTTSLKNIIDKVQEAIKRSADYNTQDSSWKTMKNTLSEAIDLMQESSATQETIDAMTAKLTDKYMNIRLMPNKDLLDKINLLLKLGQNIDQNLYSKANFIIIQDAVEQAKKSSSEGIVQKDYKMVISKLDQAIYIIQHEKLPSIAPQTAEENINKNTAASVKDKDTSVQTGDISNTITWITLIVLTGVACAVFVRLRKRSRI